MSSDMEIDEFTALHGLVLKKAGQAEEVAEVLGATEAEVAPALDAAVAEKRAMAGRGKYMVTPAGRAWLDEQYPVLFAELRADPGADAAYAGFEEVNRELLALMTRWQTVNVGGEAVPNDHSDAEYDAAVLDQLAKLDSEADPVLDVLAGLVPRLGVHRRRLAEALARASAGETDYVSGVRVASYHTVWFELHEDLLRLLGPHAGTVSTAIGGVVVLDGSVVPDREEIGNKAHSLATMHRLGMPVPPAFVLTTVGRQALSRAACPTTCGPTCWPRWPTSKRPRGAGSARSCSSPCVPARPRACPG